MRKSTLIAVLIILVGVVGISGAFNTLNSSAYWGKTAIPKLTAALDENFGDVRKVVATDIAVADLAVGTNSLGATVPDNAVVVGGYLDVTTGLGATGVTATVALELNGSADILAAVAYTNASGLNTAGIKAVIPVGTAATAVKMTGARTLNVVVTEHAFTSGVINVILEYDEQPN